MLRFIGLYLTLIVALHLAGEGQGTFLPHIGVNPDGHLGIHKGHFPTGFNFNGGASFGYDSKIDSNGGSQSHVQGDDSKTINGGGDNQGHPNGEVVINSKGDVVEGGGSGFIESNTMGTWELFVRDSGVSAMHIQIMPNNKAIIYDAASLGPSNISLPPNNCRTNIPAPQGPVTDCSAHGVMMDTITGQIRVLKVTSDVWCSSGALDTNGILVSTGGFADGIRSLRFVGDCDTCDFFESPTKLADERWYGTHVQLASGDFVLIGGRRAFNYEFIVPEGKLNPRPGKTNLTFLLNTTDLYENNLYPFVHLAPDGNLFILANFRSIMLDPVKNVIVREYPDLPGGARNYPGSACNTILPLKLKPGQKDANDIEIFLCGGGDPLAFGKVEKEGIFLPALDTCARMKFMQPNAQWDMEKMPSQRVMGDMLTLPNRQILILNGAQIGTSGWYDADNPNFTPVLYRPNNPKGQRFRNLQPTTIARMYHSSSALLISGKILVAGSNSNQNYQFNSKFPTELRVEKFSPPYLDKALDRYRPTLDADKVPKTATYGKTIAVPFQLTQTGIKIEDLTVVLYKPPFTTHGYSMNQRLLELALTCLAPGPQGQWSVTAEMPSGGHLAPPGYYNLFVTYRGVPGAGSWIHLMP